MRTPEMENYGYKFENKLAIQTILASGALARSGTEFIHY